MNSQGRTGTLIATVILAISLANAGQSFAADPQAGARTVVAKVVQDGLAILRNASLSADQKREKIQQIAYDHISFDVMARLSLGRYYKGLTEPQRAEYATAFRQYVTNAYRHTTDHYTDEDVNVTGDRKEQDGDWTVQTQVVGTKDNKPGQLIAKVDYRVRSADNQWKVIDLTIDGVSLVVNFRSQFQDIMAQSGFDVLMQRLREKNTASDK